MTPNVKEVFFEGLAATACIGKGWGERQGILEALKDAWMAVSDLQEVEGRIVLSFYGGTNIQSACGSAYTLLNMLKQPVVAHFNGVEIVMTRVEP